MKIDTKQVRELRELTGVGVMDCKRALEAAAGDMERARALLQELADQAARAEATKETKAGIVDCYLHDDGRIGVMIEVRCETDFLAKSLEFRSLVKSLALQIASESPEYISSTDVPAEVISELERQAEATAHALGRPLAVIGKIKAGKVRKFFSQSCLLEQHFIKDQGITIASLLQAFIAKSGENIQVTKFSRYQIN